MMNWTLTICRHDQGKVHDTANEDFIYNLISVRKGKKKKKKKAKALFRLTVFEDGQNLPPTPVGTVSGLASVASQLVLDESPLLIGEPIRVLWKVWDDEIGKQSDDAGDDPFDNEDPSPTMVSS